MTRNSKKALLPAGLPDLLPPDAAFEAATTERLLAAFARHGFERIKPPLVEFEDGLLTGTGAGLADQTFRLMDPVSQRMMAVRSDVTPQVARIARTRLARSARPLRLSYAGDILRVRGSELRPERQFGQVGFELIGIAETAGDAEVVLLAAESLHSLGVGELTIDLCAPTLITALFGALKLDDDEARELREALDRKDAAAVAANSSVAKTSAAKILGALLRATGPLESALPKLEAIRLPDQPAKHAAELIAVANLVRASAPDLPITIDPVERRGFEYQTGPSFTLFARGVRGELGRGGRYAVGNGQVSEGDEQANGCTLYLDSLLRALPRDAAPKRVYLPSDTPRATGDQLRHDGWVTISAHAPVSDAPAEARRLACSHLLSGGKPVALKSEE